MYVFCGTIFYRYNTFSNKKYYRHKGHPGGIKISTPETLSEKNKSQDILKLAVKRMLPGGPLAKKQLTKLKIYWRTLKSLLKVKML